VAAEKQHEIVGHFFKFYSTILNFKKSEWIGTISVYSVNFTKSRQTIVINARFKSKPLLDNNLSEAKTTRCTVKWYLLLR